MAAPRTEPRSGVGNPTFPVADGKRVATTKRRISWPLLRISLIAVVVGVLGFVYLYDAGTKTGPVLAVAQPVAAGHVIRPDDLRVVQAKATSGVDLIPAGELSSVVGQVAAVGLARDSLLARAQLGNRSVLDAGRVAIGVGLKDGQFPVALRPGDHVRVLDTGGTENGGEASELVRDAVVFAMPLPSQGGGVVVPLNVAEADAPKIAAAAAAGRVVLVLLVPGP